MDMKAEGYGGAWRRGGRCCAARTLAWTGSGAYYWGVLGRLDEQAGAVFLYWIRTAAQGEGVFSARGRGRRAAEEEERCRRWGQLGAAETERGTLARSLAEDSGVSAAMRSTATLLSDAGAKCKGGRQSIQRLHLAHVPS